MPARLRAVACGIAEGNHNDPLGRRVALLREAADQLAAADAWIAGLKALVWRLTDVAEDLARAPATPAPRRWQRSTAGGI